MPTLPYIKNAIPTSYVGAGWPFDEVDVTVNTEECGT